VKELQMKHSSTPFFSTMLAVVLAALFFVMTIAFIVIPQVTGGHPGETNSGGAPSTKYHPT
jgi:hypothetical protein